MHSIPVSTPKGVITLPRPGGLGFLNVAVGLYFSLLVWYLSVEVMEMMVVLRGCLWATRCRVLMKTKMVRYARIFLMERGCRL